MNNNLNDFLSLYNEVCKKYNEILSYIEYYENNRSLYLSYSNIVHNSIISNIYSSWEYYVKEMLCLCFEKRKNIILNSAHIKKYFSFSGFPSYISVNYNFDSSNNAFSLLINKEIVSFTTRNIDFEHLNELFKRVGVECVDDLCGDEKIDEFIDSKQLIMSHNGSSSNVERAIKGFIELRNSVSHSSHQTQLYSLNELKDELYFFVLLLKKVLLICLKGCFADGVLNFNNLSDFYKFVPKHNAILFDSNIHGNFSNKHTILIIQGNSIKDLVSFKTIKVTDKNGSCDDKEVLNFNDKVGVTFENMLDHNFKHEILNFLLKENYQYKLVS